MVPLKVDIEWSYINLLELEFKLEVYVFFQTFQGFLNHLHFDKDLVCHQWRGLKSYCPAQANLRVAGRAALLGTWGFWVLYGGGRWIEAMGCHTDSSYFRYYIHLQIHRIWMNMFRGDSNITKVTYQNEWWLWWCVWSPLLGVATTQYMPESQFVCCLTFLRVSNSMFQLGGG